MAKGTICPLQNLGKKLERKHTRKDLFQYRNCKLKQNVESIFYRTFKVHSKVTFQSRSTAIFVGNLRQGFWYFARSRSREIPKNTKNTAKFSRNLIKYMSVQHIWNLFQLYGLFTCRKLAKVTWNSVTETYKQIMLRKTGH